MVCLAQELYLSREVWIVQHLEGVVHNIVEPSIATIFQEDINLTLGKAGVRVECASRSRMCSQGPVKVEPSLTHGAHDLRVAHGVHECNVLGDV
jgi:hypothetical protein